MENPSPKDESKGEEMLLYNSIYHSGQPEALDDNDSDSKSCGDNESLQTGRWNNDEHIRFIKGCLLYGNNWKRVKKYVRTRSSAQIRSHAQKYLIKLSKKYPHGDISRSQVEPLYDLKSIENIINNLTNGDMEYAEKLIMSKFKNTFNDKSFCALGFDEMNFKSQSTPVKKERKKKERIFLSVKVQKNKKLEEMQKMLSHNRGKGYDSGTYGVGAKEQLQLQQENYIHFCLDSHDPNELTQMLFYFENRSETSTIATIKDNRCQGNEGGCDLNSAYCYYNEMNKKELFELEPKAYGLNSQLPEGIQDKEATPQRVRRDEEGQYYMGLLNDTFRPKSTLPPSNAVLNDQSKVSPKAINPSALYLQSLQAIQANTVFAKNSKQSAFSHQEPSPIGNTFTSYLVQRNAQLQPQFYQQYTLK